MPSNTPPDRSRRRRQQPPSRRGRAPFASSEELSALSPAERRRRRRSQLAQRRRRQLPRRRRGLRIVLVLLALFASMGMAGIGTMFAGYEMYLGQIPDATTLADQEPPMDSYVYAADGTLIKVFHAEGSHHLHVALANVSRWARLATIDIEDRHFYENGSWDAPRIVSAAYNDVVHKGGTQGASTITEQLAKVAFLNINGSHGWDYKIKEFILGTQIEQHFSKDQILEMYLNRIDYGNQATGLESAAELYFHKHAKDLDLAEASMLAGLPNSPTYLNPLNHDAKETINPAAKERQRVVLAAMENNGDITQAQAQAALKEKLVFHGWWESEPNLAPDFVGYLQSWLVAHYGDTFIDPGGWAIHTSINLGLQAQADDAVNKGVNANYKRYNVGDGALVSLDPKTGEVLAMSGSYDYSDPEIGQLNMATAQMQPGSTIKLFTYTAAIASREFTMTTPILDAPIKLDDGSQGGYTPHNYDLRYHGVCPLMVCLGNSFNIPAVKTEYALGIPYITNLEISAGLTSLQDPGNTPCDKCWAATLGALTRGISPLELADGAAMLADLGIHHDPMPVTSIVDSTTGKPLFTYDPVAAGRRVVPENVAFIIDEITSNDNNRRAEFGAHSALTLKDRRVSAKTGTTDFFVSNWTVGWTPDITTAVWVGNPTPSCLRPQDRQALSGRLRRGDNIDDPFSPQDLARYGLQPLNHHCGHLIGSTGVTGAAPIWNDFMTRATKGTPVHWYTKPADVVQRGTNDDGLFYLPGTENGCFAQCYDLSTIHPAGWRPAPPPAPAPTPAPTPAPGG